MNENINGFTLSEVLISLVIIGVIAAITVPAINLSAKDKEFAAGFKKNYSVISNSLRRAQADYGVIGDNTVIFTPDSSAERSFNTAKRFAVYLNTMKVCKNSSDNGCSKYYYPVRYASAYAGNTYTSMNSYAAIILADGSIFYINQQSSCEWVESGCNRDSDGNCKKDSNGNNIPWSQNRSDCGHIKLDVNGAKGPNKFGRDLYYIGIYQNKIVPSTWKFWGGTKVKDIILGRK